MSLSRRSLRDIAVFNRLKATPSQALYSAKRLEIDSNINTFIEAYKEAKNDKADSAPREVVGDKIS